MKKLLFRKALMNFNSRSWPVGVGLTVATLFAGAVLSACGGGSNAGKNSGGDGTGASGNSTGSGGAGTDGGSGVGAAGPGASPTGITEYHGEFMMPVERNGCSTLHRPQSTPMWGISTTGRYAGAFVPSRMSAAAFGSTLIVSWVGSADYTDAFVETVDKNKARYGHLSTFDFTEADGFSKVSDFYFEGCTKDMGSVAVSPDGKVIGALCLAIDDGKIGDYQDSAPEPNPDQTDAHKATQDEMYLLEWTGGKITQTPDKIVRLSELNPIQWTG